MPGIDGHGARPHFGFDRQTFQSAIVMHSQTARHQDWESRARGAERLRDRDIDVRKSPPRRIDPDAGHSRNDRGRDYGAHRDADPPEAIGIALIDTVCDQHHS